MKSNELGQVKDGIKDALDAEDNEALAKAFKDQFDGIKNDIMAKFEELKDEHDVNVLASRGVRQLTNEETKFYESLTKTFTNGITGGAVIMPKTIFESVFDDLRDNADDNPLALIDLINTTGATEWIVSKAEAPITKWGQLGSEIDKELSASFILKNTMDNKLSCFIPVAKDVLDLGYTWLDAYVREYMGLGLKDGLIKSAISGDGSNQPYGMAYDYDYETDKGSLKTPVPLKAIDPASFATIFATLTKNPMGKHRALTNPTIFVDAETYYKYVYANDLVFNDSKDLVSVLSKMGIKTCVCETGLTVGQAVIALPKRYWMSVSMKTAGTQGMVEFSDDAQFLQDIRVYKGKLYGEGMLKDNNAAALLDLTNLVASV